MLGTFKLNAIFAVDQFGHIGVHDSSINKFGLLYSIKDDLKYFKETTMNGVVIVGSNTFSTFSKPLQGRLNIVITHNIYKSRTKFYPNNDIPSNVIFVSSIDGVIDILDRTFNTNIIPDKLIYDINKIFIIGGSSIYKIFSNYIDKYIITYVSLPELDLIEFNTDRFTFVDLDLDRDLGIKIPDDLSKLEIARRDVVFNYDYSLFINGHNNNLFHITPYIMDGIWLNAYHINIEK